MSASFDEGSLASITSPRRSTYTCLFGDCSTSSSPRAGKCGATDFRGEWDEGHCRRSLTSGAIHASALATGFTLDAASNVASRTGPSATYSYDTADRLTGDGSQTFSWSDADRLTARGSDTFSYDPLDRLTGSTVSGTSRTYAYSGDGLLQGRTQGTTTSFLWDPATSPSRLLMQGSDRLIYGLGPLYVVKGDGSTVALARDGGKSVRAEVSSAGSVSASFRYRAYGQIVQSGGASAPTYLGYAGQLVDPSGLLYMRARWYDPRTGRFVSRDPLTGQPTAPRSLNSYGYAGASPLMNTDPLGLAFMREEGEGVGLCRRVSTCGEFGQRIRDALLDEVDAAEAASRSDNPWIAATGKVEKAAAVVAVGAAGVAGGAAVVAHLPAALVATRLTTSVAFAGAGTGHALRVADALSRRLGGLPEDWAHMTSTGYVRLPVVNTTIQIHWFENAITGVTTGAKWKIQ